MIKSIHFQSEQNPLTIFYHGNKEGMKYPDMCIYDGNYEKQITSENITKMKVLFEVEPNLVAQNVKRKKNENENENDPFKNVVLGGSSSVGAGSKSGIGQVASWLNVVNKDYYGVVTNFDFWIFISARKVDKNWKFYITDHFQFASLYGKTEELLNDPKDVLDRLISLMKGDSNKN